MRLTEFRFKNTNKNSLVRRVQAQLLTVVDEDGNNVNLSVLRGIDAVLNDAINGTPLEPQCPLVRIMLNPIQNDMQNEGGMAVLSDVQIGLYFIYYVGMPSQDPVETSFEDLRDEHLFLNLDYLKYISEFDNRGMEPETWWKWNEQFYAIDNDTPFKYLNRSVSLPADYACTRIDLMAKVQNYIPVP